jgi:RNA polymerase-binding transcription factor DksA
MMHGARTAALKAILTSRQHEAQREVQRSTRAGSQGDIDLALLQMKTATLTLIDAAFVRFDAGAYGVCLECGAEISERRLRALPFAGRCHDCEEMRDRSQGVARHLARQNASLPLFADPRSSRR